MAKDLEFAVEKTISILSDSFSGYNENNAEIDKKVAKFWSKFKKRLPEQLAANFEADPAASKDELTKVMTELGSKPRIQMNMAMFLHDNGIEIG